MSRYQRYFILVIGLALVAAWVNWAIPLSRGLDIAGGIRAVLQVDPKSPADWPKTREERMDKMGSIRRTILNRVKGIGGVSDPIVFVQGDNRLVVELPGVKDPEKALDMIKSTAALEFYYLQDVVNTNNPMGRWRMEAPLGGDQKAYVFTGPRGETINSVDDKQAPKVLSDVVGAPNVKPILTGKDLLPNAKPNINGRNQIIINIEFNDEGANVFRKFTARHVGDYLAVFFDNKLLTAPSIQEAIPSGKAEITGFRSLQEARSTAEFLNAGALPVPLKVIAKDTVEPTLGMETVNKVVFAGIIGLLLVVAFMVLYYRLPGAIASIALGLYALFVIGAFKAIHATMSLAGIAALIISIGMAVDANILIFERLKEELRSGKTLRAAIDAGFGRAFTAIFDSNMCTAITCAILMWFGQPSVQSFALTLLVGVAISMFTAITVTRTILHLLVGWEWAQNPSLFGLGTSWFAKRGATMDVVGKRAFYFLLSGILILPGLFVLATHGLKKGIEFRSGTSIQVSFDKPVTLADVRAVAERYSPGLAPEVQLGKIDGQEKVAFIKTGPLDEAKEHDLFVDLDKSFGVATTTSHFALRDLISEKSLQGIASKYSKYSVASLDHPGQPLDKEVSINLRFVPAEKWDALRSELNSKYGVTDQTGPQKILDSVSTVEPTISRELTTNAIWAVIFASFAIVLYLTGRFAIGGIAQGFKYGVCAVIALIHDACFILGGFAILGWLLGWEIDSLFVTAVLTIIGFSVHDTIVVFDRIRENLRHRQRGESFEQLCNRSILQTFSRSINTSFTVVMTLLALIIFGGPLLRHFYVALLAGIIIGTYSSIFNATPLVIVWDKLAARTAEPKKKAFEDKPLVEKAMPSPLTAPAAEPSVASDSEAEDTATEGKTDESPAAKAARIKRKTVKKKRF